MAAVCPWRALSIVVVLVPLAPRAAGGLGATPDATTPAPPPAPTATALVDGPIRLNEVMPAPRSVDWDGDGQANSDDEWIELYNSADQSIDLTGWILDDVAGGGSPAYVLPQGSLIAARGYFVAFHRHTRLALNNDADSVTLMQPDGGVADTFAYARPAYDVSFSRTVDGAGEWTSTYPPSPGGANRAALETATPRPTPPSGEPLATPPQPARVLISEVMYDPTGHGQETSGEWIELRNVTDQSVSLAGWSIGDSQATDGLPELILEPKAFTVVAAAAMPGVDAGHVITVTDGRIGNGLANLGDAVILRDHAGLPVDAMSYGNSRLAFDPPVPSAPSGASLERLANQDTNSASDWNVQMVPSPGRPPVPPVPPPAVVLNEFLPAPRDVDWDDDGIAGTDDEWVELYNAADAPVNVAGWLLDDEEGGGRPSVIPAGVVEARSFLVVFRRDSPVRLNNDAGQVRLLDVGGRLLDQFAYAESPGYDRSYARTVDGAGEWTRDYAVTPGESNRSGEEPVLVTAKRRGTAATAFAIPLSRVRELPPGAYVYFRAAVSCPPGQIGDGTMYVQDGWAGVQVYRSRGPLGPFALGDVVEVSGHLSDARGERRVLVRDPSQVRVLESGLPPQPVRVRTGHVGEALEAVLVAVRGQVRELDSGAVTLDDGSGALRVYVGSGAHFKRPRLKRGQTLSVMGIVSQYTTTSRPDGGYRLLPRQPSDFGVPLRLPNTGAGHALYVQVTAGWLLAMVGAGLRAARGTRPWCQAKGGDRGSGIGGRGSGVAVVAPEVQAQCGRASSPRGNEA